MCSVFRMILEVDPIRIENTVKFDMLYKESLRRNQCWVDVCFRWWFEKRCREELLSVKERFTWIYDVYWMFLVLLFVLTFNRLTFITWWMKEVRSYYSCLLHTFWCPDLIDVCQKKRNCRKNNSDTKNARGYCSCGKIYYYMILYVRFWLHGFIHEKKCPPSTHEGWRGGVSAYKNTLAAARPPSVKPIWGKELKSTSYLVTVDWTITNCM